MHPHMRVATWNVNSLRARLEKVQWWLERASPDVLLMQETKLGDGEAPVQAFRNAGYELVHHGQGQWNGVAIASRIGAGRVTRNFGLEAAQETRGAEDEVNPFAEARMVGAMCGEVFVVSLYAPNGRSVDSPHFRAKLEWFQRLSQWLSEAAADVKDIILGGDFNVAPADIDVWDPAACQGGTHVSPPERAAFQKLCQSGLTDIYRLHHPLGGRYTWWDYRGGNFHRNIGMRIDHLLISTPLVQRAVWTEIDREARKGKPMPSDHAPLVLDLDARGKEFDPGWPAPS
jgi:exodeoxyribonuclease-3